MGKSVRVNLSVPKAIHAELSAAAAAEGLSKAAMVMRAVSFARPYWRKAAALAAGPQGKVVGRMV